MCLAIPGKIIEINGNTAVVDYGAERIEACILEKFGVGDFVIVQNRIVVKKVSRQDAEKLLELVKGIG